MKGLSDNTAILRAPGQAGWLVFQQPVQLLAADRLEDVLPVLRQVDQALERGLHAAGYVAYEAGPAFDAALVAKAGLTVPYAWFGLYPQPAFYPSLEAAAAALGLPAEPDLESAETHTETAWTPTVSREEYDRAIQAIKDYIAQGYTYQVNYTFRLRAALDEDPFALFARLARAQRAPYAAYLQTRDFILCSASPELFFTLEGETIVSRPMKGTAARGRTQPDDAALADWLYHSEKNRAENVMIVDMVRNDIGRIARTGSVQVPELFQVEKYPTVWQMTSTVVGETQASLDEIFSALFPPASITGAPKASTMKIIDELESTPRQVYTGAIGYAAPGRRAQFNVAIRTVLFDHRSGQAEYGTGGGITWDSLDTAEYEECLVKAKVLSARIPRFALLESLLWTPEEGYFLLERHLRRLAESAAYFDYPLDLELVRQRLQAGSQPSTFNVQPLKVRLLVDEDGQVSVESAPLGEIKPLVRLGVASEAVRSADPFLYHKTTHRAVYERKRLSCPQPEGEPWDDVLLWNERGELTEATNANIVVELDGERYTPPVDCGLLEGVYRGWMLEQGLVQERVIRLDELRRASGLWVINSVRGMRPALWPRRGTSAPKPGKEPPNRPG